MYMPRDTKNTILVGELRPRCCDTLKLSCLDLSTGMKQKLTRCCDTLKSSCLDLSIGMKQELTRCCDTLKSSCLDLSIESKQELTRIQKKKLIQVGKETGGTQENQRTMDA